MNQKLGAIIGVICLLVSGCASFREQIQWDAKAEKEHLEPHQEREQLMRRLAEP
jgi:hypothetical protein